IHAGKHKVLRCTQPAVRQGAACGTGVVLKSVENRVEPRFHVQPGGRAQRRNTTEVMNQRGGQSNEGEHNPGSSALARSAGRRVQRRAFLRSNPVLRTYSMSNKKLKGLKSKAMFTFVGGVLIINP